MNRERTNNHNGEVPTTFCDDLMPLSQFDALVCGAGTAKMFTNLVREVGNANAIERGCRVGHCGVGQRRGSNGDVDEQKSKPSKIV